LKILNELNEYDTPLKPPQAYTLLFEKEKATPTKISEKLGIPQLSAWEKLAQMVREGLLVKEVRSSYRQTKKAMLILSFMERRLNFPF